MTYTRAMGSARKDAEKGQLSGVYAGLLRRMNPRRVGLVTGCLLALAAMVATSLAATGGDTGAVVTMLARPLQGVESLAARLVLGLVAGLLVGYGVGNGLARLRNVAVAAYLRIVWSRYQHHVANDLLDKL